MSVGEFELICFGIHFFDELADIVGGIFFSLVHFLNSRKHIEIIRFLTCDNKKSDGFSHNISCVISRGKHGPIK